MYHTESEKAAILSKLLPPYNLSVSELANQEGVCNKTVYTWRKKAQEKGAFYLRNRPNGQRNKS